MVGQFTEKATSRGHPDQVIGKKSRYRNQAGAFQSTEENHPMVFK
jgi:hypothetical protein